MPPSIQSASSRRAPRAFRWPALALAGALALALLGAPAPSAGDARADCRALHWNLVALLEEATAALFAAARVALEAEGVAPERTEAVLRHLREPGPVLAGSPHRAEFEAHFAAFERAQRDVLRSAGCADPAPPAAAPGGSH